MHIYLEASPTELNGVHRYRTVALEMDKNVQLRWSCLLSQLGWLLICYQRQLIVQVNIFKPMFLKLTNHTLWQNRASSFQLVRLTSLKIFRNVSSTIQKEEAVW